MLRFVRNSWWWALLASSLAFGQSTPNTLTPQDKQAGWMLLFDGKTMDGWDDTRSKNPPGDSWAIEDGCLKALPKPRINEDLFSKQTFADFELAWEWRIAPGGNSGVKYRIQDHLFLQPIDQKKERFEAGVERSFVTRVAGRPAKGQDYVVGFEYQMTDDAANSDAAKNSKHTAGALYDIAVPVPGATRAAGQWNQSRIVLHGKHVEHWLNGVKVVDTMLDSADERSAMERRWGVGSHIADLLIKQAKAECPISLQNHGDACWFRSIKMRKL